MKREGYGGRGDVSRGEERVLAGVLAEDVKPAGSHVRQCAHIACERFFISRQDGDNYCSQACDFAANPQFKGGRGRAD